MAGIKIATYTLDGTSTAERGEERLVSVPSQGQDEIDTSSADTAGSTQVAYMRIEGLHSSEMRSDIINSDNEVGLEEILNLLNSQTGYAKFIINSKQDARQEKMAITKTHGDSFIATFTGREPHILGLSGYLVAAEDNAGTTLSWYKAFLNAYEFFLRASRLAKWRCKIKLVFPGNEEFYGYMTNLSVTKESETEPIIPMSFSLLIVDKHIIKPLYYGNLDDSTLAATTSATKIADVVPGASPLDELNAKIDETKAKTLNIDDWGELNDFNYRITEAETNDPATVLSDEELERYAELRTKEDNYAATYAEVANLEAQKSKMIKEAASIGDNKSTSSTSTKVPVAAKDNAVQKAIKEAKNKGSYAYNKAIKDVLGGKSPSDILKGVL